MGRTTAIKHPVPDRAKPSFVIFDIRALWRSGLSVTVPWCQNCKWRLNPVWHRVLYSCSPTHMATVDNKGLKQTVEKFSKKPKSFPVKKISEFLMFAFECTTNDQRGIDTHKIAKRKLQILRLWPTTVLAAPLLVYELSRVAVRTGLLGWLTPANGQWEVLLTEYFLHHIARSRTIRRHSERDFCCWHDVYQLQCVCQQSVERFVTTTA